MKYIITFAMCLFLMCSCDNHDFELSEKEQVFYINQMLHFSIEPKGLIILKQNENHYENILFDVHFGGFFDDSSSEYHLW